MHPLAIAAIVILGAVAITYYSFNKSLPFVHHYTLHALVRDSVNVRGGSPVRIAGIDVGTVDGVSPAGDASKITLTLDSSALPVHKDATVTIRDRLFLEGSYYLELDPGTPSAPTFHDGDTVPFSQTTSPVQFYKLLSTFDVATRTDFANLLEQLNQGFGAPAGQPLAQSGAAGLKSAIPQLVPVFRDTAVVFRAFRGTRPGDVRTLLTSSANVFQTLAQSSTQLADLVSGLNATASALASSDSALAQTISGIDQTVRAAPPALDAIDRSLPPLRTFAQTLDPSLKVSPPILDRLASTATQLSEVLAPAQRGPLLASLTATFQQLPALLTELTKTFPIGKQITDCLQTHLLPVLKQQVPDGSLSSGRPAWQDFIHFLPGVAGASGSFDANGPYTRNLVGAGTNTLTYAPLNLVGTAPPGSTALQGARPVWAGDLNSADFRPDVPCATQPVPSLASATGLPDLQPTTSPAVRALAGAGPIAKAVRPR